MLQDDPALHDLWEVIERQLEPEDWRRLARWKRDVSLVRERAFQAGERGGSREALETGLLAEAVMEAMTAGWIDRVDREFERARFRWSEEASHLVRRELEKRVHRWSEILIHAFEATFQSDSVRYGMPPIWEERDRCIQVIDAATKARRFAADAARRPLTEKLRTPRYRRVFAEWEKAVAADDYPTTAADHAVDAAEELAKIVAGEEKSMGKLLNTLGRGGRLDPDVVKCGHGLWTWANANVRHGAKQPEEIKPTKARWAVGKAELLMHQLLEADAGK